MRKMEWFASLLVMFGVLLMIDGHDRGVSWEFGIGVVALTFGVRVAIDCGKAGGGQ